jgi:hypothetical protein
MPLLSSSSTSKLDAILSEYRLLADSSPTELRKKIPSEEIWRFFIDGHKQKQGRGLSNNELFVEQPQPFFWGLFYKAPIDLTVNEYVKTIEKATHPWDSALNHVLWTNDWSLNEDERNKYTLRDLLNLDKAWLPFEQNEPGYLKALYTAFTRIFDFSEEITVDFIKTLHQLATQEVALNNFKEKGVDKKGAFRFSDTGSFGLATSNFSPDGLQELVERLETGSPETYKNNIYISFYFGAGTRFNINHDFIVTLKELQTKTTELKDVDLEIFRKFSANTLAFRYIQKTLKSLIHTKTNAEIATVLYKEAQRCGMGITMELKSTQPDKSNETLESEMHTLIANYQTAISKALSAEDKLLAIISFIQTCEQLHPFIDGNCRVFCMLLLNHLLLRNGFPLVILDDPNRLDGFSTQEIMNELLQGMSNTLDLIKNGVLYDIRTSAVISMLESKYFLSQLDYFRTAVNIEEEARTELASSCSTPTCSL